MSFRKSALSFVLAAGALSLPVWAGGHPLGLNENHSYGILGDGYESPHVKWAKPYAGGKLKTLVMAPEWSQRETIELAQRLSLDYTPWMCSSFTRMVVPASWYHIPTPGALIDQLLRKYTAETFDVIVIGKLDWAMLPPRQRFDLLAKVSEGSGLVYVCPPEGNQELDLVFSRKTAPEGVQFIAKGIPFSFLPQLKDLPVEKIIRAGRFGKGRVVALEYGRKMPSETRPDGTFTPYATVALPALTPQWAECRNWDERQKEIKQGYIAPDDCLELELVPYEYYQSLVARAVVWASGKEAGPALSNLVLSATLEYPASAHAASVDTVTAPAGSVLKAAVRSRYDYTQVMELPSMPAQAQNRMTLPALPAGDYFLDVWLTSADGRIFDWASHGFTVTADIAIQKITLAGRSYNRGDNVTGEIRLSRALAAGETLIGELGDNYGRTIEEKPLASTGEVAAFSFTIARPLAILHYIYARVVRQDRDVCTRRLTFPVRAKLKGFDDFHEIVWASGGNSYASYITNKKLAEEDQADAIYLGFSGATDARNVALANLTVLPYTGGFGHFGSKVVPVTGMANGCMTAPATFKAVDDWGAQQSDIFGPYGPLSWSHGDESYYANSPDSCWSETCLPAFREYLKGRYPDLDALNREWKTACKTWEEVMPATFEEAFKSGNYAPWLEHRLAQQLVFARLYAYTAKAMSVNDPNAHAGFDGNNGFNLPNGGINWWVLKDHVGELHGYIRNSEEMEIFRSFAGPHHLAGMWYGTYGLAWQIGPNTVGYNHFFPWYSLFHGLNSTWFYVMSAPGLESGYAPDFTNMPFMQASRDSLAQIRTGAGKLLLAGELQDDGIAIHYSEASRLADSLLSGVTDDKLEGGIKIDVKQPLTTGWSERIMDFNEALEHCGLQYKYVAYEEVEADALAQRGCRVFIMPHSRAVSEKEAEAIRRFVNNGGLLIADILPGILNGHGTRQPNSLLADLFPSREPGVINRIGQGSTVLLGDKLRGYGYASFRNMQGWGKLEGRCKLLSDILTQAAGIKPRVAVTHRGQGEMPPTEIFRTRNGDAEYVGLLRDYFLYDDKPYPATVDFGRKSHLYNLRTGQYLGFTDRIDTDLSFEVHLYAMLPYRVTALKLAGPGRAAGGERSEFRLAVNAGWRAKPGLHVFRVEVLDPAGKKLPWYAANVMAENGRATYALDWALNEAPGKYTVHVQDTASGVAEEKTVEVK